MEQKKLSIYTFKKGDLVTRLEPSKPYPNMIGEEVPDRAFIGKKLKFLGIANACIYLEMENTIRDIFSAIFIPEKSIIDLPLDVWLEGWGYYLNPIDLFNLDPKQLSKSKKTGMKRDSEYLKSLMQNAIENEDYETANKLMAEIKKIEKEKNIKDKKINEDKKEDNQNTEETK